MAKFILKPVQVEMALFTELHYNYEKREWRERWVKSERVHVLGIHGKSFPELVIE